MSATELEEVQALLEHVLPDPRGFAGRLLQQALAEYGQLAGPAATAFYEAATAEDAAPRKTVIVADQRPEDEPAVDTNILLAGALGACECWGLQAACDLCQGQGSVGWTQPIPELFEEFVRPAVEKLAGAPDREHRQRRRVRPDDGSDNRQTEQGEDA